MLVTWDPENGDQVQEWQFDPEDVPFRAAKEIEKHFGNSYDQWVAQLQIGSIEARSVLLWYMLQQVHKTIKFDAIPDFRVRQLKVQMGSSELEKLWASVKRMKLKSNEREAFTAQFEADLRDALDREGKQDTTFDIVGDQLAIEGAELPKPA